jgi:hypothetical protein
MHAEYSINGGTIMLGEAGDNLPHISRANVFGLKQGRRTLKRGVVNGATGKWNRKIRNMAAAGFIDEWGNQWWLNDPEKPE